MMVAMIVDEAADFMLFVLAVVMVCVAVYITRSLYGVLQASRHSLALYDNFAKGRVAQLVLRCVNSNIKH
jgi:hypothetical protein